ncbi:MAG: hypothetical protein WBM97_18800 [Sedimenticolaceae bacterium]
MRLVIAIGGNALLRRGEPLTEENQRRNISVAAASRAPIARDNSLVIMHGNGPQVGLLAMQSAAFVELTGGIAGIGGLEDAQAILDGRAGTLVVPDASAISWWD